MTIVVPATKAVLDAGGAVVIDASVVVSDATLKTVKRKKRRKTKVLEHVESPESPEFTTPMHELPPE